MALPEMHGDDREMLRLILGIPIDMLTIPDSVLQLYAKAQRAFHRSSGRGGMSRDLLMAICLQADAIKMPVEVPSKFGHLKEGTAMYFIVSKYQTEPCTFIRMLDERTQTYQIRLWNEVRPAHESQLRMDHPGDATPKPVPQTTVAAAVAPDDLVDDEDDEDESDVVPSDEAIAADDPVVNIAERLKELWPKNRGVDVCVPGEATWSGKILGHGSGRMVGRIQVRPDDGSAAYRWVPAEHLYAVDDAGAMVAG